MVEFYLGDFMRNYIILLFISSLFVGCTNKALTACKNEGRSECDCNCSFDNGILNGSRALRDYEFKFSSGETRKAEVLEFTTCLNALSDPSHEQVVDCYCKIDAEAIKLDCDRIESIQANIVKYESCAAQKCQ